MIQFNLLPDVKLEYIKAQNTRRAVIAISTVATLVCLGLVTLLFAYTQIQKRHLENLSSDIARQSAQLKQKPGIDRILTVQNQLNQLTELHSGKPAASRLFGYLNQVTPDNASISDLTLNFKDKKATISGSADSLSTVNKYVDTLKFTTFTTEDVPEGAKAFTGVVMGNFGLSTEAPAGKQATYTLTFDYDPTIFDITKKVTLKVPADKVTTRSQVDRPESLFTASPEQQGREQ